MKVTQTNHNIYAVKSDSGNSYTVTLHTKLDELGSMFFTWSCTCPARTNCKHIRAVEAQTEPVDDQAAERIE